MKQVVLLLSLLGAVLPAFVYLLAVRWLKRLRREPLRLLLLVMAWGAIGGTAVGFVGARWLNDVAVIFQPGRFLGLIDYALYVPLAEEAAKGAVLVALACTPRLTTRTNGLVFGMAVGLGFAITENLVYLIHIYDARGFGPWYVNLVIRTLFSSTVHGIASALFGLGIAWGKVRISGRRRHVVGTLAGLGCAVAVHGSWNAIHYLGQAMNDASLPTAAYIVTPFLVVLLLFVTWITLRSERNVQ